MGHLHAMGDSQQGHDLLKGFEKKARELRTAAAGMTGAEQKATLALAEKVERLSTTDKGGATLLVDAEGREYVPGEIDAEINAALKKPADDAKKKTDDEQPKAEKDNDLDELN
jgi:hypothetical protein